jgi:hypothetical protein
VLMQSRFAMAGSSGPPGPTSIPGSAAINGTWQSLTVPAGVSSAKIELQGSGGDKGISSTGGGGAYARKNALAVTAGQTLYYYLEANNVGPSYVSTVSGATSGANNVAKAANGTGSSAGLASGSTGDVTVSGAAAGTGTAGWALATGQSTPSPAGTPSGSAGAQDYGAGGFAASTRGGYAYARFTWS